MQVLEALPGFTFGCDPELFVVNGEGEFVTAEGLLPGTKEEPYKVDGGAIQVDGMAAEFNIDPVSTFEDFDDKVMRVLRQLKAHLPRDYQLRAVPSAVFSEKEWDRTPDVAKILGCTPDFNAWTGKINPPPHNEANPRLRTASGHLHIGWTDDADVSDIDYVNNARDLVKQMDWYLGGWSLSQDADPVRRSMYGKAGAMRFKPYGVEYRVLSNFWLSSKSARRTVWNRMMKAVEDMRTNYLPDIAGTYGPDYNDRLIKSINNGSEDAVLWSNFRKPLKLLDI